MKLFPARQLKKGFTLIELLVVIGILGILAAALIATIDPFEQLNKASDANAKNTAVEFLNGTLRYYTTHSAMPWSAAGANCNGTSEPLSSNLYFGGAGTCLTSLIAEGELKSAFTTASGILSSLYVTSNNDNVTMCYKPKSKSQQRDANSRYVGPDASTGVACPGGAANPINNTCYWCTQ